MWTSTALQLHVAAPHGAHGSTASRSRVRWPSFMASGGARSRDTPGHLFAAILWLVGVTVVGMAAFHPLARPVWT